ncbi:MAG TPA: SRPBCC family protein [Actinomycetales bacterium]|nr:SRPBCC family protein [Actinomycetales bacterium]
MVHIQGSVVIRRPIEDVFAVVADPTLEPRYNAIMASSEKVTPGPVRVGTRFRDVTRGFGGGEMTVEVTEIEPPNSFRTRTASALMTTEGGLSLRQVEGGTELSWSWQVRPLGWLRATTPLLALFGRRLERRTWTGLKRYLEQAPAPAPAE